MINIGRAASEFFIPPSHRVHKTSHVYRVFIAGCKRSAFFMFGLIFCIFATLNLSDHARADCVASVCYEYDSLGRLSKAIMPGGGSGGANQTIEYTYDVAGNRTSRIISEGSSAPPPVIAVNSAGVAQSPYTVETISNPYPFFFVVTLLKNSGGIAVYSVSSFDLCASGGTFSDTSYSFTGNGCEIIYQP